MNMLKSTYIYAIALMLIGIIGYIITSAQSITALIPTFFGIIILILAIVAKNESKRPLMMHIAAGLALVGLLATVSGIVKVISLLGGAEIARPAASISQAIMALFSAGYLSLSISSFISARKNRSSQTKG